MIFGGLQKNSLIDFPGKISCVLFTLGCNFDCPYCHNPELIKTHPPTPTFDQQWVYDFLEKRRHFLDGVVISGGEPTLQTDLEKVCCRIKEMGFPVKIDSNGSRPKVLERLIGAGLVDYLAMDIKTDPARYAPLIQKRCSPETIHRSIRIIMEAGIDYEFKTTCIRPLIDTAVIETIARLISGARRYALQEFHNTGVLHPEFFDAFPDQFDETDLADFKTIAAPYVETCLIR